MPGIVHRYPDRVLLKPLIAVPGLLPLLLSARSGREEAAMLDRAALERAFDYIRERPEIWEVIVTGGDPVSAFAAAHR